MSYRYETERPEVFTEEGQKMFLAIRDQVKELLAKAGAVRMDKAIAGQSGNSWTMLACVDRLVELKEICEITPSGIPNQWRVFGLKF